MDNQMVLWITDGGIKPSENTMKIAVYPKTPAEVAEILQEFSEGGCAMKSAISFVPGAGKLAEAWGFKKTLLPFAKIDSRALVVLVERAHEKTVDTSDSSALINAFNFRLAMCV